MKNWFCDTCSLLDVPSEVESAGTADVESTETIAGEPGGPAPSLVIVGLGNPGERHEGTPHNVGRTVVDRLAASLSATWVQDADADLTHAEWKGEAVCLVKPTSVMNRTGPLLARLAQRLGVDHARCILVYDDLDLPLGSVRTRMRGSDGGHRGVRSIIEAFQTDEFRRVKIGVKREGHARGVAAVLTPVTGDEAALMAGATRRPSPGLASWWPDLNAMTERARVTMRRVLDGAVHGATTVLHRSGRLPVPTAWPGARRRQAAVRAPPAGIAPRAPVRPPGIALPVSVAG
jgi:PTH1 family peptidyl-tRNA hydrolase